MINGESSSNGRKVILLKLKLLIITKVQMNMEKLENVHPGEVLLEEFLRPLNISAYRLSMDVKIPQTRISEIIKGRRRITADTALRLSNYFGNSAKFWLGLQDDYDIEEALIEKIEEFKSIKRIKIITA
jgi:addiction module HigA family antidote